MNWCYYSSVGKKNLAEHWNKWKTEIHFNLRWVNGIPFIWVQRNILLNSAGLKMWLYLFLLGCMDDIVTVLAEEHGCLEVIKVNRSCLIT